MKTGSKMWLLGLLAAGWGAVAPRRHVRGTLPVEVYVYALDREGAVHGYMAQTVGLDLTKVKAGLKQSGIKLAGHLDLPPGEYRLRSLVRNGVTGAATVRSAPLTVPAVPSAAEEPR